MAGNLRAVLNTEQTVSGKYEWVITAVDAAVGTMPQVERSKQAYATEGEAHRAGELALDKLRSE